MKDEKKILALILEKDEAVEASISDALGARSYAVETVSTKDEALGLLGKAMFHLAFVGNGEDGASVFEVMREMVKASPMTSLILVTDLPEKEVGDRAEGYGILGSINRAVPIEELGRLLDSLEKILGSL